jgi:hypothetical protein
MNYVTCEFYLNKSITKKKSLCPQSQLPGKDPSTDIWSTTMNSESYVQKVHFIYNLKLL